MKAKPFSKYEFKIIYSYFEFNNESIRNAIEEWRKNRTECEKKYGPIGTWCVEGVSDMSYLLYNLKVHKK